MNKAIFFDRDGIVNVRLENNYVKSINEFIFEQNFFQLFKLIKEQNYLAILVTNQQCIDKGIITTDKLYEIHTYMQTELLKHINYRFDDIFFCPHLAESGSKYRKPEIGMFTDAIKKHNIDVSISWTIGDTITDIQAGKKVGTKTIFVDKDIKYTDTDFIYSDLFQVYNHFLNFK
jgi:D-glycero-D-manno-heptose 1,7-bisphosphate phosphatase